MRGWFESIMGLKREIKRKIFHLASMIFPLGYIVIERENMLIFIAALFVISLGMEIGRIFIPKIGQYINPIFESIMRGAEKKKISGATYLLAGAGITIYYFDKDVAIIALLLVSVSDTAAAIIGTAYGKVRLWGKSLEGSTAYFAATGMLMMLTQSLTLEQMLVGLFTSTLVELLPIPINDNLTMPVIAGFAMQMVGS